MTLTVNNITATATQLAAINSGLGAAWDMLVDPASVMAEYRFGTAPDPVKYTGKNIDIASLAALQARTDFKPMEGGYDGATPIGTGLTRINSQCGTVTPNFTAANHRFDANPNALRLTQSCAAGSGEWGLATMGDYVAGVSASVTINARGGTTETPKASLSLSDAELALINVGQACSVVDADYGMCRVSAKSANDITIEQVQGTDTVPRTLTTGNGFAVEFFRDVIVAPVTAYTDGTTTCTVPTAYAANIKAGMQVAAIKTTADQLMSFGNQRVQAVNTSTGVVTFTAALSLFSNAPTPSAGYLVFMPDLVEPQLWTFRADWSLYAGSNKAIAYRGVVTLAPRGDRTDSLRGYYTRTQKQALIDRGIVKPIWQQPGWAFPFAPTTAAQTAATNAGLPEHDLESDFENFDMAGEGPNVITLNPHFFGGQPAITRVTFNHYDAVWLPDGADGNIGTPNARRLMFFKALGGRKLDYAKIIYEHGQIIHIIDGRVRSIDILQDLSNYDWRPHQVGYVPCAGSFAGWYGRNLFFPLSSAQVNNDNWMDVHSITLAAW